MREQLKLLVTLQHIDLERERGLREREDNPRQVARLEEELAAAAQKVEATQERQEALRKERRGLEREIEEGEERLKRGQHRLLEVKTNQEYKAMLKELEHISEANRLNEDRVLELMEEISVADTELGALRETFSQQEKAIGARIAELEAARARFEVEAARLEERRQEVVASLAPELVSKYDFIRSRRNGQAVVPVRDAVCQACHMDIPPQSYNELQRGEALMTCPTCHRIIFWAGAKELAKLTKEAI